MGILSNLKMFINTIHRLFRRRSIFLEHCLWDVNLMFTVNTALRLSDLAHVFMYRYLGKYTIYLRTLLKNKNNLWFYVWPIDGTTITKRSGHQTTPTSQTPATLQEMALVVPILSVLHILITISRRFKNVFELI